MEAYGAETCTSFYQGTHEKIWFTIRSTISQLVPGRLMQLGRTLHDGNWMMPSNNSRHSELWAALKFHAENQLQQSSVASARVGVGIKELPAIRGFVASTVLLWRHNSTYARIFEIQSENGVIPRFRICGEHED